MSFLGIWIGGGGAQSISPGMVDTDFLNGYDSTVYAQLPKLNPDDVTAAVLYALSTSQFVQVKTPWIDDRCRRRLSDVTQKDHLRKLNRWLHSFCRSKRLFCRRCSDIEWALRASHPPANTTLDQCAVQPLGEKWIFVILWLANSDTSSFNNKIENEKNEN